MSVRLWAIQCYGKHNRFSGEDQPKDCDSKLGQVGACMSLYSTSKKPAARLLFNRSIIPLEQAFLANKQGSEKKGPPNDQTQSSYTFSAQLARRQVSQVSQGGEGLASSMHGPSKTATSGVGCGLCLRASYMYTRRCQWHTLSGRYTRAAPLHVAMPVAGHGSAVRHVAGMIGRHGA